MRYLDYEQSRRVPNVVVDGSANESTVLMLTHWPGMAQPPGSGRDLSAQMAFDWVRTHGRPANVEVITSNHFDQDGLVAMLAFVDPDAAFAHEELLIDVAAAGDFATYRHRTAARASMALWTLAQADRSPIADSLSGSYEAQCAALYPAALRMVVELVTDPERFRNLWADEDAHLSASEAELDAGRATITEVPPVGLAIVESHGWDHRHGHRFGAMEVAGLHPMAVHNRTDYVRLLTIDGDRYRYTDRYETWVQYVSRTLPRRVDLRPLADDLTAAESHGARWRADAPGALTPAGSRRQFQPGSRQRRRRDSPPPRRCACGTLTDAA